MSRYPANIITKSPATPTGPTIAGRAPGIWTLNEAAYWTKQGLWPNANIQSPDTFFRNVSLLLSSTSLSNANNNLFVDSSGAFNPVTRIGNPTQGAFSPYSTNWSNYFNGTNSRVSVANNAAFGFGTGDFTVEFWLYYMGGNGYKFFFVNNSGSGNYVGYGLQIGTLTPWVWNNGDVLVASSNITPNTWQHHAVVRSGSTLTIYLNGTAIGSTTWTVDLGTSRPLTIGWNGGNDSQSTPGYFSNFRVVKGTAVYTSNFTPPTAPLTAISGTSVLTCQNNRFVDNSSNNFTITTSGGTNIADFGPFSPTYPGGVYNQNDITNWSGYFDGSGDYLALPSSTAFGFGTGDFTIECWVNPSVQGGHGSGNNDCIIDFRPGSNGAYGTLYSFNSGASINWYANTGVRITGGSIPNNTWTHLAVSRVSGNTRLFINGVQSGSTYVDSTDYLQTDPWVGQFHDGPGAGWFQGFISNLRIVKGTGLYSSTFTPPTTNLTAISGTSLLTMQNAAFTDNSTNNFVITQNGNVTVAGNSPFNTVGYWSNYFDGSGDYLSVADNAALQFGTGNFTVECWFNSNVTTAATHSTIIGKWGTNFNTTGDWALRSRFSNSNQAAVTLRYASGWYDITTGVSINDGAWHHLAFVRENSTTLRVYVDGVLRATQTISASDIVGSSATLGIGGPVAFASGEGAITGYVSNARLVKGTAVYTSAFTPPTTPLTAITNTSLLTCQNGRFIDNSTNAFTVTPNGDTSVQSFDPFYTATIASNGGSMYFDGNGDYLRCPSNPAFNLGTSNYTVEFFIYTSSTTNQMVFDTIQPGIGGGGADRFFVYINTSQQVVVGPATNTLTSSSSIQLGAWNHVAVVRSGTTRTIYINGVSAGSSTQSENLSSSFCTVGFDSAAGGTIIMNGYLSNLRVTKGTALYTTNFTPPTAPLTPSANTSFLVNGMNAGVYDGTTINDFETAGNAQVRYFIGNYYGGSFDGSGDYLATGTSSAIALGTSDFTFECWVYPSAFPNDSTLVYAGGTSTGNEISLQIRNNQVASHLYISGSHSDVQFTDLPVQLNRWSHVAISRVSGVLYGFLNGVRSSVAPALTTNFGSSAAAYVAVGDRYTGTISNARITKNVAIYSTATYTVPTSPLTSTSNTAFLTCQNTTFVDNSPNALAITAFGNATAGATGPFTYTGGGSVFFDNNSSNRVKPVANPIFAFGTNNFTVEAWIYVTNRSTENFVFDTRGSATTAGMGFSLEPSTGKLRYSGSSNNVLTSTGVTANNWTHVAWVRNNGTLTGYINGVSGGSISNSDNLTQTNGEVGNVPFSSVATNMYINNLRVTNGIARYTSNFTPPAAPFPTY